MFDHYEWFKNEVYRLTQIDLNYYKEKQMRRRIDTLAKKNGADSYETYIDMISADKAKFKQFINFITINVSATSAPSSSESRRAFMLKLIFLSSSLNSTTLASTS